MKKSKELRQNYLILMGAFIPMLHIVLQIMNNSFQYLINPVGENVKTHRKEKLSENELNEIFLLYKQVEWLVLHLIPITNQFLNPDQIIKIIFNHCNKRLVWINKQYIEETFIQAKCVDNIIIGKFGFSLIYDRKYVRQVSCTQTVKVPYISHIDTHDYCDKTIIAIKDGDLRSLLNNEIDFHDWEEKLDLESNDPTIRMCRFLFWLGNDIDFTVTAKRAVKEIWH